MPVKKIEVPNLGTVHLYKRRGTKNLRLSISHTGTIRVSLPPWVPYRLGLDFAIRKQQWLLEKRQVPSPLAEGQRVGKAHRLVFTSDRQDTKITTRINHGEIKIMLPRALPYDHPLAQQAALAAARRALKLEAESLLPNRLSELAVRHGFSYKSVTIKCLSSRWGSCSENHNIVLNSYLMQLPWELIDYVLLHELVHTKVMSHGKPFWTEMAKYVPNLSETRKIMRQHRPSLVLSPES